MVRRLSVRPSVRHPSSSTMLKDLLFQNRWADQSQILCGASLGRGNDILFAASWSHDQDGRHAHIWYLDPFYGKVKFENLGFSIGKSVNSGFFENY